MINHTKTVVNYSKEIFVQPKNELNENPKGVEDFPIFWREPAGSGQATLESTVTRREQHHSHYKLLILECRWSELIRFSPTKYRSNRLKKFSLQKLLIKDYHICTSFIHHFLNFKCETSLCLLKKITISSIYSK